MTVTLTCAECGRTFTTTGSHAKRGQRFCSRECYHAHRPKREQSRFWSYVDKDGPNGCWVWTGGHTGSGYGQFCPHSRRAILAHRYVYEMVHGSIPDGLFVCHHCDNRQCVNPEHLFLGSSGDNMQDAAAKGRTLQGERHPQARFTASNVQEMRRLYDSGLSQGQIAKRFGTTQAHVQAIVTRRLWAHVP